jgi:SGNH domain-containing protein
MEMLRHVVQNPDVELAPCRQTIKRGIDYANTQSVDTVVLSAHWYWYLVDLTDGGKINSDAVLDDLRHLIESFVRNGKRVYVILNIPRGDGFDPRSMIQRFIFPPAFRVNARTISRADIEKLVGPPDQKVRKIAKAAGATVIDPTEI